ncbi:MAG: tyrosine-type recombinase/integrase [Lachnospiraceae bacterium]|nr:tyrosine-type recombinase/integrase [Lachnospiraceae bacterium]
MRKVIMKIESGTKRTLRQAYDEHIRIRKVNGVTDRTIHSYNQAFKYFTAYIDEDTACHEITHDTIIGYIEHVQKNCNASNISINSYLRSIRTFLYYCMSQDYMSEFKIRQIKAEKPLKETYTEAELEKLLKKPNIKKCSFTEFRNWVMVCYLLGTGNRRTTVCNIKIGDLDFENDEIRLKKVKNKKPYTIPISPFLKKSLQEYLIHRKGTDDEYLFCSVYGGQLTADHFNTIIYKYNTSRGVIKTSLHLFRHTFAKTWILNGGDPFRLKTILGHNSMAMVNEYVNMYGSDLKKDFSKFNPLDNMECLKKSGTHIKM